MRKELDKSAYSAFTDTLTEMFTSTLVTMFDGKEISFSLSDAYAGGTSELMYGYESQTAVVITEGKSGFDGGLFFHTKDITMLASLMMMMESEGTDELGEDDPDAIKELCQQLLSSLTVPLEKLGQKVTFKADHVQKNDDSSIFKSESYFIADIKVTIDDRKTSMRFFMDEDLLLVFSGKGGQGASAAAAAGLTEEPDFSKVFSFPESAGGSDEHLGGGSGNSQNIDMLMDIDVPVSVKMGSAKMFLKDILTMGSGNIVELDESADEPVELVVNNKVIARGEVVIVDGYFGFRIREIVSRAERLKKLKD